MTRGNLTFACGQHTLAATRFEPPAGGAPRILTLAGLGVNATRQTLDYLLEDLQALGHGGLSFDFSGNGDSTGIFQESCLRRRREEVLAAARLLDPQRSPILLGTSMGGHLSASVVSVLSPETLILFCPAAYPAYALDVNFDGNLARPWCYPNSPAFAGIREFAGDLLIIGAKLDQVVPREVLDYYMECASSARSKSILWLDCDHFIHRWLPYNPIQREEVVRRIHQTIQSAPSPA
jgi:alpha-beta hydrolase superfamily lysophospholipase